MDSEALFSGIGSVLGELGITGSRSAALTRRQREIFDYVSGFVADHGYSPSLEEIASAFGLSSVATVHKHVKHLVDKGYLRKAWNRSRSVEPVPEEEAPESFHLPILGTVAAGRRRNRPGLRDLRVPGARRWGLDLRSVCCFRLLGSVCRF